MAVTGMERLFKIVKQSGEDRWKPTGEGIKIAEHIREVESAGRRRIELSTPLCPTHKVPGKYLKTEGTYQKAISVFKCPKNHEFNIPD